MCPAQAYEGDLLIQQLPLARAVGAKFVSPAFQRWETESNQHPEPRRGDYQDHPVTPARFHSGDCPEFLLEAGAPAAVRE